jgi:hypothetical protein
MKATSSKRRGSVLCGVVARLPQQSVETNGDAPAATALLAARVLEDAVRSVTWNINAPRGPRWLELNEACEWIWSDNRDWAYTFLNVCDLLGLEPTAIRGRLETLVARQARRALKSLPSTPAPVVSLNARRGVAESAASTNGKAVHAATAR